MKGDANTCHLHYFSMLIYIIQLNYSGKNGVTVFMVDWWDVYHKGGFKVDKFGFPMVNVTCKLKADKLYGLAS